MDMRTVAAKVDDAWHNVRTLVRIDHRDVGAFPRDEVLAETKSLLALRVGMSVSDRATMVRAVSSGSLVC